MNESILDTIKKLLGLQPGYTVFDLDVITQINSVLSTIHQLGIGPPAGFMIEDSSATWIDLIGNDPRFNSIKTYIYLKVRLAFDPPANSFGITAMEKQVTELEWRLNVLREEEQWVDPNIRFPSSA